MTTGSASPQDVVFRYVDLVNNGRFDRMDEVYSSSASWDVPGMPLAEGLDAINATYTKLNADVDYVIQSIGGCQVSVMDDRASGRTYLSEWGRLLDGSDFDTRGVYDEEFVRLDTGWFFSHRRFRLLYRGLRPGVGKFYRLED